MHKSKKKNSLTNSLATLMQSRSETKRVVDVNFLHFLVVFQFLPMLDKLQKKGKCLSFKGEASRQIFVEKRVGRGTIYIISMSSVS